MKKWWWPAAVGTVALAPVLMRTPRPQVAEPGGVRTIADAVRVCRASELTGWELVAYAQRLVHRKFTRFTILSPWEPPALAFRRSRGFASQYNTALWMVLTRLGFDAERVFATRVRQDVNPWWRTGHVWVQVRIDGRALDVCAGLPQNRPGAVGFIPVTEVRSFRAWTLWNTTIGMVACTVPAMWKAVLKGQPVPRWMDREFGSRV